MRAPGAAGARAPRRRPAGGLRGRGRGDAPGAASRLVPLAHVGGQGDVRRRPRRRARLAAAVASAVRGRARRAGRRGRARRAHGDPRVAGACREPPGLASGHAVARGLDPPAPRRGARSGRRLRRRAELLPLALPLAHGVDRPDDARRRRRGARGGRRAGARDDRRRDVAPRARARGRHAGRRDRHRARRRRRRLRVALAARPRRRPQHERGRPRPLPRRPGALECARPRNGQPAAARPARPGGVHGPARPVGVRARARRALAERPRRRRGRRRPRVPVRAAGRRLPRPLGCGAGSACARNGRGLGGRRRRARRGHLARAARAHLPPLRRVRRHHLAAAGQPDGGAGGRRPRGRAATGNRRPRPRVEKRCQAPIFHRRSVAARDPRCDPRGRMRSRRRDRRGRDVPRHGGAPALAALRAVPGPRAGRPRRPRGRARSGGARAAGPTGRRSRARGRHRRCRRLHGARRGRAGPRADAGDASVRAAAVRLRRRLCGRLEAAARCRPGLARCLRADRCLGGLHDARAGEGATARRFPTGRPPRPSGAAGATSSGRAARRSPAACGSSRTPARRPRRAVPG